MELVGHGDEARDTGRNRRTAQPIPAREQRHAKPTAI